MNTTFRQPLIAIACGILLWAITAQINHYLAVWHLNLFTGGLMIAFPALRFRARDVWRIALPLGLWVDASSAVPFGMHALIFLFSCAILHRIRGRLPRTDTLVSVGVAIITNAIIFLVISIAFAIRGPVHSGVVWTLVLNLILSSLFIALIAPWYSVLQSRALMLVGIDAHAQAEQIMEK